MEGEILKEKAHTKTRKESVKYFFILCLFIILSIGILFVVSPFVTWPIAVLTVALICHKKIKIKILDLKDMRLGKHQLNFQEQVDTKERDKKLDEMSGYIAEDRQKAKEEYARLYGLYIYEKLFNLIFGTQLMLLERLERDYPQEMEYDYARIYWLEHCTRIRNQNYSFNAYIDFLKKSLLISVENNIIKLSLFGSNFLLYIRSAYSLTYRSKPW